MAAIAATALAIGLGLLANTIGARGGCDTCGSAVAESSAPPAPVYWGAWIGRQFTGKEAPWDWRAVQDFQNHDTRAKQISTLKWSAPFYASYCSGYCAFRADIFELVRRHGAIPFFLWANTSDKDAPRYTDAAIASGTQDAYIVRWARAAKAWGRPFFLEFDAEMNAPWYSWGVGANGTTAAQFVAAWRHVHNIFASLGATNATWVWCPNVDPNNKYAPIASLYPGNSYVDWTCLDGYSANSSTETFDWLFRPSYAAITGPIAPSKPMFIGEMGATESGGEKAKWITTFLRELPSKYPKIRGFNWFDVNDAGPAGLTDWPIESSSAARGAFSAGIGSSIYVGKDYAHLATCPIAPPPSPRPGGQRHGSASRCPAEQALRSRARHSRAARP